MRRSLLLALLAPLAFAPPLQAQDDGFALGMGLRHLAVLSEDDLFDVLAPQVYFTIRGSESLMVEPSLGIFRFSNRYEDDFGSTDFTLTVLRLGLGFLFTSPAGGDGSLYWGPRIGVGRVSESSSVSGPSSDTRRTDFSLAGVAGGEFFVVPRLGLGGEVGLEYTRIGDDGSGSGERTLSSFATIAELRLRWYLR